MKQSQSQPPILSSKNQKLLNVHQQPQSNSIQNKSRNNSLKKISFNQVGSSHNVDSQSLNSLGLFPKIQQKVKQRHNTNNQLTVESSLQRYNSGKWHLPNSLMKKRQRLLTQGNNIIHQNTLIANDSFVSLNNSHSNKKITLPITKQNESIKNTMVEFRKKIEQNRIYIKKEIEKKNKENNNDSRVKRDASLLLVNNNTKAMKKRKQRVASSRFVVVMEDSSEGVGENNALAINNNNSSNKARSKRTIQTASNNNGNKLQRSFAKRKSQSNKNKKQSNFNSYNANNNKEKNTNNNNNAYGSNNSNGNNTNNVHNKNNNKTHRNKQKTQPQASSSMSIKNNISPHKDQKQHSISKRKSEGLFGQLQVILDEKIRQDVSKERILEEETRLRDLLLKLNTKHKQHDTSHNNYNHRAKYHSYHELGPDSNNNKAISIEYASSHHLTNDPTKHHTSLQSSSQQPLTLHQSSDTLPLAQSGTKLTQQLNHQQWHKLQLQSTSQISYTKSSFENELNKISQYADRNDASLEKYLSMRKELMKLGFQVQFGFNQNSKNQKNRKKNQQKSTNDMQKDKENNNT